MPADQKFSEKGNRILPNTFQHPNFFVDELMYLLTPEENTVLTFAVRRILGFQANISSRRDHISLSQFTEGVKGKGGEQLSYGCGLGVTGVRSALSVLEKFKILLPTTDKPDARKGQEYWLQEDATAIDWQGLHSRSEEKSGKKLERTSKARSSVGQKGDKGSVGQKARGTVGQKSGVLSDSNTKPTETHENKTGAKTAPDPSTLTIENQIALGVDKVTMPTKRDFDIDAARDVASLIDMQCLGGGALALAFMEARGIIFHQSKIKGQRKAARSLLEQGVKPEHVTQAVALLSHLPGIVDLFSVQRVAVGLAHPAPDQVDENAQVAMEEY